MPKLDPLEQAPKKRNPACKDCGLYKDTKNPCLAPYVGESSPKLMLVGGSTDKKDDVFGIPFGHSDAGMKLQYLLDKANVSSLDIRLDNVVKCRLPDNRKEPKKSEIMACAPHLLYNILSSKPSAIVALGSKACETLYPGWSSLQTRPKQDRVKTYRGFPTQRTFFYQTEKKRYEHTCWVMPTHSPKSCLQFWPQDDLVIRDIENAFRYSQGEKVLSMPTTKIKVVETYKQAIELVKALIQAGAYSVDCETTGLDPHGDRILCIGFCYKKGEAHILPLLRQNATQCWTPKEYKGIVQALTTLFLRTEIWGQGLKFDVKFFRALTGVRKYNIGFDSMVAHHCIDENKPHNLTFLSQWYLNWDKYDTEAHSVKSKGKLDMTLLPDDVLWKYLGADVDAPYRLRGILMPILKSQNLLTVYRAESALIRPIADMEFRGVRVDVPHLENKAEEYRDKAGTALLTLRGYAERLLPSREVANMKGKEIKEKAKEYLKKEGVQIAGCDSELRSMFGDSESLREYVKGKIGEDIARTFNPNSPKQLPKLLEAANADLTKRTPSGLLQVNKDVLAHLAMQDNTAGDIAKAIQDLRSATKMLSTYVDGSSLKCGEEGVVFENVGEAGLVGEIGSKSRTHANYNISRTVTGRLSAYGAALTVPKKGGIRDAIVPDTSDHRILSVDYSKIELCIMAWLANDDVMAPELIAKVDLHKKMAVAVKLNRYPTEQEFQEIGPEITELERSVAKAVNFGIPYGAVAETIVHKNPTAFPLSLPFAERKRRVQKIIDVYFNSYTGVYNYLQDQYRLLMKRGYLRTKFTGRKRRIDTDWFRSTWGRNCGMLKALGHIENEARNFQIQSTASDQLTLATRKVYDLIEKSGIPGFRLLMTVHDQLLFNCHKDYISEAETIIREGMEVVLRSDSYHKYDMPLLVDVKLQRYWGESEYQS